MKKIILALLLPGCINALSFAQSSYLENGQSGMAVSAGFSANEDFSGFNGEAGYSFAGIFDVGLSVSRFGFDQQLYGEDLHVTILSPFVFYLPVKQTNSIPLSAGIHGSYQRQIFSNEILSDNDIEMTGDYFAIGGTLFRDIEAFNALKIQPKAGIYYITGETKIADASGESEGESNNSTAFHFGVSLLAEASTGTLFVLYPSVGFQEDVTTYSITISFILPKK